jgi:ADP-heptose:LPS heptosyltransferase
MRSTNDPSRNNQASLVLFPGALGDFVCFLPTLERISLEGRVHVLSRAEFADLVSSSMRVCSLDRYEINRLFVKGGADEQRVQDFFSPYRSIYSWFGAAHEPFAEELKRATRGRARLFSFRPVAATMHQVDYYLSCVGGTAGALPSVTPKTDALAWCDAYWRETRLREAPLLVIAPGSGAREKNWPVTSYRTIADWWHNECHGSVLVLLGPVEEERGGLAVLCQDHPVARGLTLRQVAALLPRCAVFIGNDSGITHLAAALGVCTVALFGPSDPLQWAPRGRRVVIIRRGSECSPCSVAAMKACVHRKCLATLEPAGVIMSLSSLPEVTTSSVQSHFVNSRKAPPSSSLPT